MKRCIVLLSMVLFLSNVSITQTIWQYNFGTATGSFTTPSSTSTFLPDPPVGSDQVRVGNAGGGFELVNPLGTDSELQITSSSAAFDGRINKFSVIDFPQSKVFSIRFNIKLIFNPADAGYAYFFIGNGNYFTDNIRYNGLDVFAGIRWRKFASDAFATTSLLNNVLPDEWFNIDYDINPGTEVNFELFGNNSNITQYYNYNSISTELLPSHYTFYINETLIGNYLKGVAPILAGDQNIDSYMILAEGSPSNLYKITVDDFYYSNELIAGPLPVELSSFTAKNIGKNVILDWHTETEVNNYGFEVERKVGSGQSSVINYQKIGFVNGNGNSNSPKEYSFIDDNTGGGNKYQYRLKQIDNDGQFAYSNVVEIQMNPEEYSLSQNYPNPFNPATKIKYSIPDIQGGFQPVRLAVFDVLGNEIAVLVNQEQTAGNYEVDFNTSSISHQPSSGIYFYRLQAGSFVESKSMILLK